MKRILPFLIGCALLLSPLQGMAATAVSPFVEQILTRADAGIARGTPTDRASFFERHAPDWMRSIASTILILVDSKARVTSQQQGLLEYTACLRTDLHLLERKLEETRQTMFRAWERRSATGVLRMLHLARFLQDQYNLLLKGYNDPSVRALSWYEKGVFEEQPSSGWCCVPGNPCAPATATDCHDMAEFGVRRYSHSLTLCEARRCGPPRDDPREAEAEEPPVGPFHTDYLPPSITGFGCDIEAMDRALEALPGEALYIRQAVRAERDALASLKEAVDSAMALARSFHIVQEDLEAIVRGEEITPPDPAAPPPLRTHKRIAGPLLGGRCRDNLEQICVNNGECSGGECVDVLTVGVCEGGDETKCVEDSDCSAGSSCAKLTDAITEELRGPFSFERNHLKLTEKFAVLRRNHGTRRPPSLDLAVPLFGWSRILSLVATDAKTHMEALSREQGSREALSYAVGSDPLLTVHAAIQPLSDGVKRLVKLGNELDGGLRGFVRDYAYFLRRTCIDRPCNARLNNILQIVFANECFPYGNGEYLEDTCEKPRWKKCEYAAFYPEEEMPEEEGCPGE